MLALGFLLMIGMTLIAEGFGAHVPKGYIYTAMAFSAARRGPQPAAPAPAPGRGRRRAGRRARADGAGGLTDRQRPGQAGRYWR